MFGQEDRDHFFAVGESLLPVLVIEVSFNILFLASLVLLHNELTEGVLQHSTEDPSL